MMDPDESQLVSQDETSHGQDVEEVDILQETPPDDLFMPPSIDKKSIVSGASYSYHSPIPARIQTNMAEPCVLGVDEAGRGPVLGPMVYGVFYTSMDAEKHLLKEIHHFDDSKALTPTVRSKLMQTLSSPSSDLHEACGWATRVMSARDISCGMLKASGTYNLNNQAMDATIDLINGVCMRGINVKEVYVDTIGHPAAYQKKLERVFPTMRITVAKKADSLYPCVSAASVCAKVTRDAALEVCYESYVDTDLVQGTKEAGWGSGYPSDARCSSWLKHNIDPMFGWGNECRFSWGTAKDLLESKNNACKVDWPEESDAADSLKVTSFFSANGHSETDDRGELANWFGVPVTEEIF